MLPLSNGTFTYTLTNDSLTLLEGWGIRKVSIFQVGTTAGSVTGTAKLGDLDSTALATAEDKSINIVADGPNVVSGVVIAAPAGCTLQILASF